MPDQPWEQACEWFAPDDGVWPIHDATDSLVPSPVFGVILQWVESLGPAGRRRVFKSIIRADAAIARAFPSYRGVHRVERACLLLLWECAAAKGLNAGELAALLPEVQHELLASLHRVACPREQARPAEQGD